MFCCPEDLPTPAEPFVRNREFYMDVSAPCVFVVRDSDEKKSEKPSTTLEPLRWLCLCVESWPHEEEDGEADEATSQIAKQRVLGEFNPHLQR